MQAAYTPIETDKTNQSWSNTSGYIVYSQTQISITNISSTVYL